MKRGVGDQGSGVRGMVRCRAMSAAVLVTCATSWLWAADETSIGIAGQALVISQLKDLKPLDPEKSSQPVVVRILETTPVEGGYRYALEYLAFKSGSYDLRRSLVSASGQVVDPVTDAAVIKVQALLPAGPLRVGDATPQGIRKPRFYRWIVLSLCGLWALCGIWLWKQFPFQKPLPPAAPVTAETVYDYVRRELAAAADGKLTWKQSAELERLLLSYWQESLGLGKTKIDRALAELRRHPEAGTMLAALEQALHRPGETDAIDIPRLLEPVRQNVAVDHTSGADLQIKSPLPVA